MLHEEQLDRLETLAKENAILKALGYFWISHFGDTSVISAVLDVHRGIAALNVVSNATSTSADRLRMQAQVAKAGKPAVPTRGGVCYKRVCTIR